MSDNATPQVLEDIDMLQLKLTWSELTNTQLQIRIIRNDLLQAEKLLKEKSEAMQQVRDGIVKKYGIDPNVTTFDDNGKFIPITPEMRKAIASNMPVRF